MVLSLPPVRRQYHQAGMGFPQQQAAPIDPNAHVPPYGQRKGYVPRNPQDFGIGGAFPEIHIKQYPLMMGRKKKATGASKTVALRTDASGKVAYDEILRQGMSKDKILYSKYTDLVPTEVSDIDDLMKPTDKQVADHTEKTRQALEKKLEGRLAASTPRTGGLKKLDGPTFIKYTPANQSALHNSGASTRIIKLHEMPVDPLEPPKFRVNKGPRAPPSPPVPVMHSPPRKVTLKDQQNWKVPPCVSNWKNNRGYVIPLHQRVAADGRHLQESKINDKFAKLAESLYIAEREARKEVELRAQAMLKKLKAKKTKRTDKLRDIAKEVMQGDLTAPVGSMSERMTETPAFGAETPAMGGDGGGGGGPADTVTKESQEGIDARNRIREERRRERRKQRAKDRNKPGGRNRDKDRDISEKVALGQETGNKGSVYDSRLFDRDSGIGSGFGGDDDYNLYDKQLFNSKSTNIYKPTAIADVDTLRNEGDPDAQESSTARFKAAQGFEGSTTGRGNAPVQFEKDKEQDPFGMEGINRERREAMEKSKKRSRRNDSDSDSDDEPRRKRRRD